MFFRGNSCKCDSRSASMSPPQGRRDLQDISNWLPIQMGWWRDTDVEPMTVRGLSRRGSRKYVLRAQPSASFVTLLAAAKTESLSRKTVGPSAGVTTLALIVLQHRRGHSRRSHSCTLNTY